MVATSTLIGVTVDGLAYGVVLALLGVSITLVFGLGEVLNLAIGIFAVLTVLAARTAINSGLGLALGLVTALLFIGLVGLVVDRTLLEIVYQSTGEDRILLGIFITLGLDVLLEGTLTNFFPSQYDLPIDISSIQIGEIILTGSSIAIILIGGFILAILLIFLRRTFLGKATRTIFQDERGAQLVGVNIRRIRSLIFVLSTVVAGSAGLIWASGTTVSVGTGFEFTSFALIVSIVGGVRSIGGAVVAGLLLGTVNQFANFFVGSYVATIILFVTAIVALLAKPEVLA
ncbi:branched-chain amino acid ABC transporter permease [Halobellus clavatus]|uniref:Branched-chain amino acid transport system permease protein n=1 Tax=Halobellus clavatus TaxID=660517 RepID=A0A1H3IUF5_9EURY|nr:branched-chain amino acid ABC transporter permease [Halobellus clavatus]SDY31341.1 branched-chain amino acid transport system permease protein [Halobellus clavatus]